MAFGSEFGIINVDKKQRATNEFLLLWGLKID